MAFNPSPEPPLLLADGHLDEDMMGGQTEASEVDSMEDTLHQMSMFRDYVPAQKRLMDRMNHILGEQHLKNWYIAKYFCHLICGLDRRNKIIVVCIQTFRFKLVRFRKLIEFLLKT